MCKKCKGCGKSNLGAIVTHTETIAVRLVDGVVTEQFQDSYEEKETTSINYCFECGKEITEADLYEEVQCPVCGKMVGGLTESGACQECTDEADKLSKMSKEQLILMLMKQAHGNHESKPITAPDVPVTGSVIATHDGAKATTPKEKKEEEVNTPVDAKYIEDTMKANESVESSNEAETTTTKKTRTRKKAEPAKVTDDGLNEAKEEIVEKLEDVKVSTGTAPSDIKDEENTAALTKIDDSIPNPDISNDGDVDDILKQLDNIDLETGEGVAGENIDGDIF